MKTKKISILTAFSLTKSSIYLNKSLETSTLFFSYKISQSTPTRTSHTRTSLSSIKGWLITLTNFINRIRILTHSCTVMTVITKIFKPIQAFTNLWIILSLIWIVLPIRICVCIIILISTIYNKSISITLNLTFSSLSIKNKSLWASLCWN